MSLSTASNRTADFGREHLHRRGSKPKGQVNLKLEGLESFTTPWGVTVYIGHSRTGYDVSNVIIGLMQRNQTTIQVTSVFYGSTDDSVNYEMTFEYWCQENGVCAELRSMIELCLLSKKYAEK